MIALLSEEYMDFVAIVLINFVNVELFNYIHYLILSLFFNPDYIYKMYF